MNWTKASAVAEILSSVAILITLLYLVIEIGQNTEALEASSRQAALEGDVQHLYQGVATPELWQAYVKPNLTEVEKIRLSGYLFAFLRMRERDWLQYRLGALDEATWLTYQTGMLGTLHYEQVNKWWNNYGSSVFDPTFREHVDNLLEGMPIQTVLGDLQAFD